MSYSLPREFLLVALILGESQELFLGSADGGRQGTSKGWQARNSQSQNSGSVFPWWGGKEVEGTDPL